MVSNYGNVLVSTGRAQKWRRIGMNGVVAKEKKLTEHGMLI